jgi:acetyl esterase/lipase
MRLLFFLVIFWGQINLPQTLFGQPVTFTKDTSFSVNSTFEKEKKKFPNIQIAQVSSEHVKISRDITYKNIGYRDLKVDIFEPKLSHKNVGIVLVHGGGWRSGDKTHMHQLSLALAEKGYTCLAVEYRLSLEAKYPAAVEDIQDAVFWLKGNAAKYKIYQDNIICLGTSSGGQLAALVGALNKSIDQEKNYGVNAPVAKAVVNIDGLLSFTHPDAEEGIMASEWLGGDSTHASVNWKEASALTHLSKNSPPMLFITSSYKRFSAGKNEVKNKYKEWNIPIEELHFEQSPHTFWYFHPWFIPTVNKIDEFISDLIKLRN